jgi:type I restriction enzyme M protein
MIQDDPKTNEKLYENKKDGNIGMSGSNSKANKSQNDEKSLLNENTGNEINLESFLWESANWLRGNMDASDFKAYIFPLLFYKRLSDVYDEEYQNALDESKGDKNYASSTRMHDFQIPDGSHWNDLRKVSKNVGAQLVKNFRAIEMANKKRLYGIFGSAQWANTNTINDELMKNLIEHFSKLTLSNSKFDPHVLGDAYEYLIKKFADLTNKSAGEFYTPRPVVRLLNKILDPSDSDSVYDPSCGTAGMLLESIEHVKKKKNQDSRKLKIYGQESNLNTSSIARINLFLHGVSDFDIKKEDTLRKPLFEEDNKLKTFDCVIANPPFSLKKWGYDVWKDDPYGRTFAGVPPESYGDFAWVQHMISSMNEKNGRVGVVLPSGALFRSSEKSIRKKIISDLDYLVAVIQMAENLFYGTSIAPCILVFRKTKRKIEKDNVLMINASKFFQPGRAQNLFLNEHANELAKIFQSREEIQYVSKIISRDEINEQDWNLSVLRYIEPESEEKIVPINKAKKDLEKAIANFVTADLELKQLLIKEKFLDD